MTKKRSYTLAPTKTESELQATQRKQKAEESTEHKILTVSFLFFCLSPPNLPNCLFVKIPGLQSHPTAPNFSGDRFFCVFCSKPSPILSLGIRSSDMARKPHASSSGSRGALGAQAPRCPQDFFKIMQFSGKFEGENLF